MSFLLDGLDKAQVEILHQAGRWLAERNFYLAGGTALTLYFAHRCSVDLDWFTAQPITDPLVLAQQLRDQGYPFATGQTEQGTLHGTLHGVRISFLEYPYALLQPLTSSPEIGCNLASLDDLACMKLAAIAQRGSKKDFFDIHALCTRYRPLKELTALYGQKYGIEDLTPVLYGLVYFEDAEGEPDPILLTKLSWRTVKADVIRWLKEITR